mgnify:CR=1 FL=1
MNNYLKDSGLFFKEVSLGIHGNISDKEIIQLTFNFALGCERLLKGILYDINPTYILIEPTFKNSLRIFYSNKIIPEIVHDKELPSKPNSDVITFNTCILRAQFISKTTLQYKNTLFAISNARDIIAHCELKLLDKQSLKEILRRDFYAIINSYADELKIRKNHFYDSQRVNFSKSSGILRSNLEKGIKQELEDHKRFWSLSKKNESFIKDSKKRTEEILKRGNTEIVKCPACKNDALLYLEPYFKSNQLRLLRVTTGYVVKEFRCLYCNLGIKNPSILDNLGLRTIKESCARCGREIDNENNTGLCSDCEDYYGKDG